MTNHKVELKTKAGEKQKGWVDDVGRGGVIVRLENGTTLGVRVTDYQLTTVDIDSLHAGRR